MQHYGLLVNSPLEKIDHLKLNVQAQLTNPALKNPILLVIPGGRGGGGGFGKPQGKKIKFDD